jgi:hypothetical protein
MNKNLIFNIKIKLFFCYSYRTRQRTAIEFLTDVHSSTPPIDILRRICEQCAITDIEYFDPVLCDGVIKS